MKEYLITYIIIAGLLISSFVKIFADNQYSDNNDSKKKSPKMSDYHVQINIIEVKEAISG